MVRSSKVRFGEVGQGKALSLYLMVGQSKVRSGMVEPGLVRCGGVW